MDEECFRTMKVTQVRRALARLHELVTASDGRVEITRRGGDATCVIISKRELESLEHALAILSAGEEMKAMEQLVVEVAASCGTPEPSAA